MDTQHLHSVYVRRILASGEPRGPTTGSWQAAWRIRRLPAAKVSGKGARESNLTHHPRSNPWRGSQIRRQVGARGWFVWKREEGGPDPIAAKEARRLGLAGLRHPSFASCCGLTEVSLMARFHGWASDRDHPGLATLHAALDTARGCKTPILLPIPRRKWVADHLPLAVKHFILTHRPVLRGCLGCDNGTTTASDSIWSDSDSMAL